jgi:tRNA-modifying protein YgfZ
MIHKAWQQYLADTADLPSAAAGVTCIEELAAVRFEGSNARTFLQGYLTCDTTELSEGVPLPTALCNLKGRVVMNGWCVADGDENVLLVLHVSLVDTLAAFLARYLAFSRNTSLVDLRDSVLVLGGLDLADAAEGLAIDQRRTLFLVGSIAEAVALCERHARLPSGSWLASLTADGVPLVSASVSETFLPQMLNLETLGAIDFEKGCYLGQEVVARAQHRGQVKRRLATLRWEGAASPVPGAEVTDEHGKAQGVLLQSGGTVFSGPALAVLRDTAPEGLWQGDVHLRRIS